MRTSAAKRQDNIHLGYMRQTVHIAADVITCPGGLGDDEYPALEIQLEAFKSPYVLRLTLPAVVYKALSEQMDPLLLYDAIASAVNNSCAAEDGDDDHVRRFRAQGLSRGTNAHAAPQHAHTKV